VIKLLSKLISTHPFALLHGGQLSYSDWSERLEAVDAQIHSIRPPSDTPGLTEEFDEMQNEETTGNELTANSENTPATETANLPTTGEDLMKLQLTRRYYTEALKFIERLHEASETVSQLLASKNKSEVIESMDFFVVADAYKLATAKVVLIFLVCALLMQTLEWHKENDALSLDKEHQR
jgi:condensin complex subunit 1